MAEERRADRTREKRQREGRERLQGRGGRIARREEQPREHQDGGRGVDVKIEELDRRADQARQQHTPRGVARGRACFHRLHGAPASTCSKAIALRTLFAARSGTRRATSPHMRSTPPVWDRPTTLGHFAPLTTDLHVDVAIVGGGITGLTCAVLLAEAGKRVAVLEAQRLGGGVTGHTTAHLTEAVDARYHDLESSFGREGAGLVRASSRDAIETIASLASGADCGFERVSGYLFTEDATQ